MYLFIGAVALVVGGARPKFLLITLAAGIALIATVFVVDELLLGTTGEYKLIKQYQRNRLLVFLNQSGTDLSDEGYNLQQAMIAIGSGGLFGQGYLQGSQHALGILPEAPTDFIFCVLAEELGFVSALALIGLYVIHHIGASEKDTSGKRRSLGFRKASVEKVLPASHGGIYIPSEDAAFFAAAYIADIKLPAEALSVQISPPLIATRISGTLGSCRRTAKLYRAARKSLK